jgi:ribosome-associated protein
MAAPDPFSESVIELAPGLCIPRSALQWQFARGGGPGGQNVNKLNTKAEVWLTIDQIQGLDTAARIRLRTLAGGRLTRQDQLHLSCARHRSQEQNRQELIDRLGRLILAAFHEPRPRRKTRPTRASKTRRLDSKRHHSQTKSRRRSTEWS